MSSIVNDSEMRGADFTVVISMQDEKGALNADPEFNMVRRTEGKNSKTVTYMEDPSVNGMFQGKEQIKESESFSMELQSVVTKQSVNWLCQAIHSDMEQLGVTGATTIAFTATGLTSTADAFADWTVGQGFWVTASSNVLNNIFYVVREKTSDGVIVTTPTPPATTAAGGAVTIISNVYKNRDAPTYNSVQTRAVDKSQGSGFNYYTQIDGVINQHDIEIPESGLWSSTANFVFESEYANNPLPIPGQTYAPPAQDRAITSARNATPGIKYFYIDNLRQTCQIKNFSFSVNNNYQEDAFAACPTSYYRGDFQVSGSFVARALKSNPFVWRDKCWNSTRFAIAFLCTHGNGEETYVVFHRNVATEVQQPDGSGTVAHSEVTFSSEELMDIQTTVTVCRNW